LAPVASASSRDHPIVDDPEIDDARHPPAILAEDE
jgi:hypothetical protein